MGVHVLPSLLSLMLVIAAAGAVGAEEAMFIRSAAGGKVLDETLCCSDKTGYDECVEACNAFYPPEQAVRICKPGCQEAYQCLTVSGDECRSGQHSSSSSSVDGLLTNSGEVVQAGSLCCSNMTGFHECVEDCFSYYPREQAKKICDPGCQEAYQCHTTVSGDECRPSAHRSSSDSSAAKGNAVDHCILGCKSSVCNKMATAEIVHQTADVVGRKGVVKHALERCNKACYKFCTKGGGGAPTATSTA